MATRRALISLSVLSFIACGVGTDEYYQEIRVLTEDRVFKAPVVNATATFLNSAGEAIAISESKNSTCIDGRHCLVWMATNQSRYASSTQDNYFPQYSKNLPMDAVKVVVSAPGCASETLPISMDREYVEGSELLCFHACHGPSWRYLLTKTVLLDCPLDSKTRSVATDISHFYGTEKPCPQQLLSGISLSKVTPEEIKQFRPDFTNKDFAEDLHRVAEWTLSVCEKKLTVDLLREAVETLRGIEGREHAAELLYSVIRSHFYDKVQHANAIEILREWKDEKLPNFLEDELAACGSVSQCEYLLRARVKLLSHPNQSAENQLKMLERYAEHPNYQVRDSVEGLKHPPEHVSWF